MELGLEVTPRRHARHSCYLVCGGKSNATREVLEPRIGAKRIEAWTQENSRVEALFIAFFKPSHRSTVIAESCIDGSNLRRIRIDGIRALLQITQQPQGFVPFARCRVGTSKIGLACWAAPGKLDRLLQLRNRFIIHSFLEDSKSQSKPSKQNASEL